MDNYYSVQQIAKRYGVGKKVIYSLISSGDLCAIQIGKKFLRVPESELQRWERAQLQAGSHGE